MLRTLMRNEVVGIYQLVARLDFQRVPFAERAFLRLYTAYKIHFEAGPVDRLQDLVPLGSLVIDVGANVDDGPCKKISSEDIHKEVARRGYVDILFLRQT